MFSSICQVVVSAIPVLVQRSEPFAQRPSRRELPRRLPRAGSDQIESRCLEALRGSASHCGGLDPGKRSSAKKSFHSLLNVLVMFKTFLVTSSTDRGGAMSDTQERPSGREWRGGCAGRSRKRAQHPRQPEGETHLFFACIIRWPDRRGSTPARDRIKLNRGAAPTPPPWTRGRESRAAAGRGPAPALHPRGILLQVSRSLRRADEGKRHPPISPRPAP